MAISPGSLTAVDQNVGPHPTGSSNYPLRGDKGTLWEAGSRVPAFISGRNVQKGQVIAISLYYQTASFCKVKHDLDQRSLRAASAQTCPFSVKLCLEKNMNMIKHIHHGLITFPTKLQTIDAMVHITDIYPTLISYLDLDLDYMSHDMDGSDQSKLIKMLESLFSIIVAQSHDV